MPKTVDTDTRETLAVVLKDLNRTADDLNKRLDQLEARAAALEEGGASDDA